MKKHDFIAHFFITNSAHVKDDEGASVVQRRAEFVWEQYRKRNLIDQQTKEKVRIGHDWYAGLSLEQRKVLDKLRTIWGTFRNDRQEAAKVWGEISDQVTEAHVLQAARRYLLTLQGQSDPSKRGLAVWLRNRGWDSFEYEDEATIGVVSEVAQKRQELAHLKRLRQMSGNAQLDEQIAKLEDQING